MKCEVIGNMISSYIDKDLNDIEKQEFEKHLSECPECREEYESLYEITAVCGNLEELELPSGFRTELHQRLVLEERKGRLGGFFGRRGMKAATGLAAAVLVIAIGLGSSQLMNGVAPKSAAAAEQTAPSYAAPAALDTKGDAGTRSIGAANNTGVSFTLADAAPAAPVVPQITAKQKNDVTVTFSEKVTAAQFDTKTESYAVQPVEQDTVKSGRMVIRTGNIALKVANVDKAVDDIRKMAESSGGYVENSQLDNAPPVTVESVRGNSVVKETTSKYANMSVRVPAEKFEDIFSTVKGMGKLVNENISGSDITAQYRDTYTRAENLKIQEKSLQQLMTKAKTVDETLKIETELNRIRTEIDMLSGDLKRWDDLVQLSTIHISLTEVKEEELKKVDVPGMWGQAYNGFIGAINNIISGLEKAFVWAVTAIPYLLTLGVLGIAGFVAVRKFKKK